MSRTSLLTLLALATACRVTDDTGLPPNSAPVAIDMTVELPEDTATDIRLEANEADGDELTFALVNGPDHGTLVQNGRRVEYTPDADYFGEDSFTFTAADVDGTSEPATVSLTITPVNDPPRVTAPDTVALVGQAIALDATVSDPEGDPVSVSWSQRSGPSVTVGTDEAPAFRVRAAGTYVFTAAVSDGTESDEVDITVRALDVSLSEGFIAAIDAQGGLWSWGEDNEQSTGHPTPITGVVARVCEWDAFGACTDPLVDMAAVSATDDYTLALDHSGNLWGWGDALYIFDETDNFHAPAQLPGLSGLVAIAAGVNHAVALDDQGQVWTWGNDAGDALGNPDATDTNGPSEAMRVCTTYDDVAGCTAFLENIVAIDAGRLGALASIAIDASGTVWTWGDNDNGILGDGCPEGDCDDSGIARPVCASADSCEALTGGVYTDMGRDHAVVVHEDGTVSAWGRADDGQLGDGCDTGGIGTCQDVSYARAVCAVGESGDDCAPLPNIVHAAAGEYHSVFVDSSGDVYATGSNYARELGDGCTSDVDCADNRSTVQRVCAGPATDGACEPLTDVIGVYASESNSVAVTRSGELVAWGFTATGIAGNVPGGGALAVRVGQDTDWASIDAGDDHAVALKTDGSLWGLGNTGDYAVGNCPVVESCENAYAPVALARPDGSAFGMPFLDVSAGTRHSGAVASDGTVWMWGATESGALTFPEVAEFVGTPQVAAGLDSVESIALGDEFSVALMMDGTLMAWGDGGDGQLGDGLDASSSTPVAVLTEDADTPDSDWVAVTAGDDFVLAQKADGTLYAFGDNNGGQLGIGTTDDALTATLTLGAEGSPSHTDWTAFSAGRIHAAGIRGGQIWTWGDLDQGRRGNGCLLDDTCDIWDPVATPVPVPAPTGVANTWADVAVGDTHTIALHDDGSVWAWGLEDSGSLGIGWDADVSVPTPVCRSYIVEPGTCPDPLEDAVFIAAADETGFAILADGSLWAWGDNDDGRNGFGPPVSSMPLPVSWEATPE